MFRYGVATGRFLSDPCRDLRGALRPLKHAHFPSITEPVAVAELLRAIDGFKGTFTVQCALRLAPMFFVRPEELRRAEWAHFDLIKCECRARIRGGVDGCRMLRSRPTSSVCPLRLLIIIAATVAILCLNRQFAGVPPDKARRCHTRGFDATVVA